MKKLTWFMALLLATVPAWSSKGITVGQLEDLLRSLQQQKKSDADVATALKQVELSEELTVSTMNSLAQFVPGQLSTEQIYVLAARSANLIPPASDLPSAPPPDAATQKVILDKAAGYVTGVYDRLPALIATRTTIRFQDNVDVVAPSSGVKGSVTDVITTPGFSNGAYYIHYINSTEAQVTSVHGVEKLPEGKDKTLWGANKMIALEQPDPSLGAVFQAAKAAGNIQWLRWELVNGTKVAVYTFSVPNKNARLPINVCCFPDLVQTGIARFYSSTTGPLLGGGSGVGGVSGNMQTTTNWHNYKTTVPYHGEFFIEPSTGIVLRMIVQNELKPSEVVHQLDTRIDYGPAKANGQLLLVPVRTIINTVVVPNGDSGAGGYTTRCTLFTSEYKDYRLSGAK